MTDRATMYVLQQLYKPPRSRSTTIMHSALYSESLSTKTKRRTKMKGRLFLDVVVRQSTPVLKLLASKDKSLLIRRNSFLILDLGLDIVNRFGRLDLESD